MMGKEIGAWGCHSYGLGLDEKLSPAGAAAGDRVRPARERLRQLDQSTCAKILNDRNRGCAGWDFHRAHQTQPDGDLSQSLIAYSGAPTGHYYAWLRIALTLPLGTRIYQVTRKSVSGDDAVHMHFKRTFSSTVYAAVGKRSDGRWGICVMNNGASQAAGAGRAAGEAERGVPRRDRERGQSSGGAGVDEGRAAADAGARQGRFGGDLWMSFLAWQGNAGPRGAGRVGPNPRVKVRNGGRGKAGWSVWSGAA